MPRPWQRRRAGDRLQRVVKVEYKGFVRDEPHRFDVLVENTVLVEAKCGEAILPLHKAKLITNMRLLNGGSAC